MQKLRLQRWPPLREELVLTVLQLSSAARPHTTDHTVSRQSLHRQDIGYGCTRSYIIYIIRR